MRISIVQHDIKAGDVEATLAGIECLLLSAPEADVYVLSEMFSTGFEMDASKAAEPVGGRAQQWLKDMAARKQAAIVGSVAVSDGGKCYNRLFFVTPEGDVRYYDKRHLFTYSGENNNYTAGDSRVVVEWRGVRFLLQVCYDLRFPVWSRNTGDYDVAIYVASWPVSRISVWDLLLKARALENQCYVVGVNRVGHDAVCEYSGNSVVADFYGRLVAECRKGEEEVAVCELNLEKLAEFRRKFPVLLDGDRFEIIR